MVNRKRMDAGVSEEARTPEEPLDLALDLGTHLLQLSGVSVDLDIH
jgi:hypothetical protein